MTTLLLDRVRGVTRAEADEQLVLRILREDGPQDRRILAQRLHVSDRQMRKAIEAARRDGELVIHDGAYYRLAESAEEFNAWAKHEVLSRMGSLGAELRAMRLTRDRRWPAEQLRWIASA